MARGRKNLTLDEQLTKITTEIENMETSLKEMKKAKKELEEQYSKFAQNVEDTFYNEMYNRSTVGSISELYDSAKPYEAKGAFAQAWSVAEVFRIIEKRNKWES